MVASTPPEPTQQAETVVVAAGATTRTMSRHTCGLCWPGPGWTRCGVRGVVRRSWILYRTRRPSRSPQCSIGWVLLEALPMLTEKRRGPLVLRGRRHSCSAVRHCGAESDYPGFAGSAGSLTTTANVAKRDASWPARQSRPSARALPQAGPDAEATDYHGCFAAPVARVSPPFPDRRGKGESGCERPDFTPGNCKSLRLTARGSGILRDPWPNTYETVGFSPGGQDAFSREPLFETEVRRHVVEVAR